jgi:hypothetical protein
MFVTQIEPRKILVPLGELYGDYEKMLLPFDIITWIAICLTISMSVATIIVVKLRPKEIQSHFWLQQLIATDELHLNSFERHSAYFFDLECAQNVFSCFHDVELDFQVISSNYTIEKLI